MEAGVGAGGQADSGVGRRGLTRQSSSTALLNLSGMSERANNANSTDAMNSSRVNALRATVNRHTEAVSRLLLSSKETLEKRGIIESAFRAYRDAFMEVSTVLTGLIEERSASASCTAKDIKEAVVEVLEDFNKKVANNVKSNVSFAGAAAEKSKSYASVVGASGTEVRVSRGPTVEVSDTTSFLIVPSENKREKYVSSQVTKDTLCRVLKPADCGLKVRRISYARDNGVRIEAFSPDIKKIRAHPGLAEAGLTVREDRKLNPRLIVHGVTTDMSAKEIENELLAQNLSDVDAKDVKIVYIFTPKQDKRTTSCILEVTSAVRKILLECGRIYLRYSACSFADHVRIVQCYRCLTFGHIAKDCKGKPSCGHCAGAHEMKDCKNRDQTPKCLNCERNHITHGDLAHSAMDAAKCLVLRRRVKDKIANTSYE
ncbi:uncharacterized protein LOC126854106 [Cataglyphis hispanica]|uniref:uncharacterized protein LOC126854106 n=1 Tax=Cataglyphis hispanica TaxID=1086592 RepID=UPI0021804F1A|nr:uncharacterized protein LOC126854106 [Cataglyphis hispanica]